MEYAAAEPNLTQDTAVPLSDVFTICISVYLEVAR